MFLTHLGSDALEDLVVIPGLTHWVNRTIHRDDIGSFGVIAMSCRSKGVVHGKTMSACLARAFQHHSFTITVSGLAHARRIRLRS